MVEGDHINFKPHFKKEGNKLPCDGEAGDLYVFTRLGEDDRDPSPQGLAELWFCTRGAEKDGRNASWKRVHFDDHKTCDVSPVTPPQNTPELKEG
jgi:hypothetical protein